MDNKINTIDSLRVFVRVAEARGFGAAAEALEMPKSTVSAMVQRLEQGLGARLLHRTTRTVRLTEAGERFLEQSLAVLEAVDAAEASVTPERGTVRGRLVVSAPVTLARELVGPLLPRFLSAYPEVEFALRVDNRAVDLISEEVDAALRIGEPPGADVRKQRIGGLAGGLTASSDYVKQRGLPGKPQELVDHHLISAQAVGRLLTWNLANGKQRYAVRQSPRLATNEIGVVHDAIRAGVGIGWLPDAMRGGGVEAGRLIPVLPDWTAEWMLDLWLVYQQRREHSVALAAFMEFLRREFGDSAQS